MLDVSATLDQSDMADVQKAIDLMLTHTRRTGEDAVARASYTFLQSARAATPAPKGKNRKIKRDSNGNQYYEIYRQGSPVPRRVIIPNATRGSKSHRAKLRTLRKTMQDKYREKPHYRAAKASWTRAFSDLGKSVKKQEALENRRIAMASRARKVGVKFAPSTNITNDLSYLLQIAPMLESAAMRAAGKSLLKRVEMGIETAANRWR